ncbi:M13 family peptidase, partial [Escherichia coli]|nr:M13 family peptidase [Escherichia coli]
AAARRNGVGVPFATYVGQDDKEPEAYALSLFQAGLGMPDRDYYLSKDAKFVEIKAAYLKHLTNVLTLAGEPGAAARAQAIVDFET